MQQLNCPICGMELLGQQGYPLLRCLPCDCWFELQPNGSVVSLHLAALLAGGRIAE